jgi:hypothetical protein
MVMRPAACSCLVALVLALGSAFADDARLRPWAEIRVVDDETGRGVPLVELETVNHLKFVTDSAGRIAFHEPGLMGREVFFTVRSHGYEAKKDGFGFAGAKLTPRAGEAVEIKITRRNAAERLCRLTGEGRYRDSKLLGYEVPPEGPNPGRVAGQDSVQAAVYKGAVYWFWGDTQRMNYPLGLFRTAGARTAVPPPGFDLSSGIPFDYFVDKTGFARAMIPLPERPEGVIWIDGVSVVPDRTGAERLVAHYSRRKGLAAELEHGIAAFDDAKAVFEPVKALPLDEKWRFPHGHPVVHEEDGKKWLMCGSPVPNVRVPATFEDLLDPAKFEAFTCAKSVRSGKPDEPVRDADGTPVWQWRADLLPVDSGTEFRWVKDGKVAPRHARLCPADAANPAEQVQLHNGTVRWNERRRRWVLIAGQSGGKSSILGEVWYAEAAHPTGPFEKAVKVVTHDRQSFYNVCHHPLLDRDGGRVIHFEGTYTADFSGNPQRTPRYEYNQVLYRLDLDAPAVRPARAE